MAHHQTKRCLCPSPSGRAQLVVLVGHCFIQSIRQIKEIRQSLFLLWEEFDDELLTGRPNPGKKFPERVYFVQPRSGRIFITICKERLVIMQKRSQTYQGKVERKQVTHREYAGPEPRSHLD